MNAKVISTKEFENRAFKLFFDRVENGDYIGALGIMYSRYLKDRKDKEVIKNLADLYSKMEEYARALFFRFKLLSLSSKEDRLFVYKDIVIDTDVFDNVVLSNYYLNKIFDDYGREGVSEVAPELSEKLSPKPSLAPFYVAYPPNEKHYKRLLFCGSQAVSAMSGEMADEFYSKVPLEQFTENDVRDYVSAFILKEDYEGGLKKLKEFWKILGDSVLIFSNMAVLYKYLSNQEKFEYYVERAIGAFTGDKNQALDLYEIIKDAKADVRFLNVLRVLVNEYKYSADYHATYADYLFVFGEQEKAKKEIAIARKIEPENKNFLFKEKIIIKGVTEEKIAKKSSKKTSEKSSVTDPAKLDSQEACIYSKNSRLAKGAVYLLIEHGSSKAMRILDDALLDIELDNEIKHTIVYGKISYGFLDVIPVVIDGVYYEIKPKKLYSEAQKNTFYTSCYALAVSKTFTSGLASENALKVATNKIYKNFKNKFSGEQDLKDVTALICILAVKQLDVKGLISNFDANAEKVLKYLSVIEKNKDIKGEKND